MKVMGYVGMGPPNTGGYYVPKRAQDVDFSPLAVVSATIEIVRSNGTSASLACTLVNQTANGCGVSHAFQVGDLTVPGPYRVWVKFVTAGGSLRTDETVEEVLP